MKAGVLFSKGDIRYADWPDPEVRTGQVRIKVMACGICGSDVPRVHGDEAHFFPIVLGHEFSGVIDEVGAGVESLTVGDHVTVAPLVPCMKCEQCLTGAYSQCRHYSFIGSREPGGFAEYVAVPAENVVKMEPNVSFEAGALFEPSTVALHGIFRSGFHGGTRAAVLGGGNIGILAMQWLRILGAMEVSVFDIADERLALAQRLGADKTYNTLASEFEDQKRAILEEGGFDYVFETAGQPVTIKMGLELVARRGTLCCIGTPHKDFTFPWKQWELINRKECVVTGSWMSYSAPFPGKEWSMTAHYFSTGALKIDDSMIHSKIALCDIEQAFALFKDGVPVKGKVLVVDTSLADE